jgi:hypothetical protein
MKVRRATCTHGLVLGLVAVLGMEMLPLLSSSAVAADDGMKWQFNEANDPDNKGRMTARLIYGVPETDAVQVSGVCEARSGSGLQASSLMLGADIGALEDGKEVDVHFSGNGFDRALKGAVHLPTGEEGLSGVVLEVDNDDPLWGALTEGHALDYALPGLQPATLPTDGGEDAIEQFVQACKSYADALGAGGDGDDAAAASSPGEAGDSDQKSAFESAKELGTVEAWQAFLSNFPSGFYADLARAYVKKLGGEDAAEATPPRAEQEAAPEDDSRQPGDDADASDSSVDGPNVNRVDYAGGTFIKNGPRTWVEQRLRGGPALRFQETFRSNQEVKLFDPSRKVHISLNLAAKAILYAPDGKPLTKLYDIEGVEGAGPPLGGPTHVQAPPRLAPPPRPKLATKVTGCEEGVKLVKGRCKRLTERDVPGGWPPGTRPVPETDDCVPVAAPKPAKLDCGKGKTRIEDRCVLKQDAATFCGPGFHLEGHKCVHGFRNPPPQKKLPSWQIEAIKKGCPKGMAWNAQEGCHEND